jgi:hypothetical protein
MNARLAYIALITTFALTPGLSAHHSFSAEFDSNKPVQLQGTITKVEWINPHTWIHIDVKQPNGSVEKWSIEGGSVNSLLRRGLKRDALQVGMVIHVDGYRSRDGANRANGRDLTFADGRKILMSSDGAGAAPPAK